MIINFALAMLIAGNADVHVGNTGEPTRTSAFRRTGNLKYVPFAHARRLS